PIDMRGDAEIGNVLAAGCLVPALLDPEVEHLDAGFLGVQRRVRRLPKLNRAGAVGQRIADEAGCRGVDDGKLAWISTELAGKPVEHHIVGRALSGGEVLALDIPERIYLRARGDDRSPIIEQVEEIGDLDASYIGKSHGQQRGAAAELEFARIELCGISVRRALLEGDRQAVLLVRLRCLNNGRQERTERGRAEYHDEIFL